MNCICRPFYINMSLSMSSLSLLPPFIRSPRSIVVEKKEGAGYIGTIYTVCISLFIVIYCHIMLYHMTAYYSMVYDVILDCLVGVIPSSSPISIFHLFLSCLCLVSFSYLNRLHLLGTQDRHYTGTMATVPSKSSLFSFSSAFSPPPPRHVG